MPKIYTSEERETIQWQIASERPVFTTEWLMAHIEDEPDHPLYDLFDWDDPNSTTESRMAMLDRFLVEPFPNGSPSNFAYVHQDS